MSNLVNMIILQKDVDMSKYYSYIFSSLRNIQFQITFNYLTAHGVLTGSCNQTTKTCNVDAWCPVERNELPLGETKAILAKADTFTVLIKNQIYFPKFSKQRTNVLESQKESYLGECNYSRKDPLCPVFKIGDIVRETGENFTEMAIFGGVITVDIQWSCDLDHDFMKHCRPKYTFSRQDMI